MKIVITVKTIHNSEKHHLITSVLRNQGKGGGGETLGEQGVTRLATFLTEICREYIDRRNNLARSAEKSIFVHIENKKKGFMDLGKGGGGGGRCQGGRG